MDISTLLLANSFLLLIALIAFILISFKNGHKDLEVKEDINKIKGQISQDE
jgi:hypothetical protein